MGIFSWFGKAVEDVRYVFMYWRDWQRLAGQGAGFGSAENTISFPFATIAIYDGAALVRHN